MELALYPHICVVRRAVVKMCSWVIQGFQTEGVSEGVLEVEKQERAMRNQNWSIQTQLPLARSVQYVHCVYIYLAITPHKRLNNNLPCIYSG